MANIKHTHKNLSRLISENEKHNSESEKTLKTSNKEAMEKSLFKNTISTSSTMAEQVPAKVLLQNIPRLWISYSKHTF